MPRLMLPAACAALVLLSGCRTYGHYDQTEETYASLQNIVGRFEQTLPRLEAEAQAIRAAGADSMLAREFSTLVQHAQQVNARGKIRVEAFEDDHDSFVLSEWVGASTYRRLNEAHGATATEHAGVAERYYALAALAGGRPDTTSYLAAAVSNARYSVVPGLYYRIANANRTPSVLGALRSPRPAPTDTPAPPPADSVAAGAPVVEPAGVDSAATGE